MARLEDRERALKLRGKGMSYSQIRDAISVSKSTLHYWLKDLPLSEERIRALRDNNPRRIERFRNTMAAKREVRRQVAFTKAEKDMGSVSKRELFIAGFFLYWAEGGKSDNGTVILANTDPDLIKTFMKWLDYVGVPRTALRIRLQLYADMNPDAEIRYWMKCLGLPKKNFRMPTIKKTPNNKRNNYKGRFGHGTCDVIFHNQSLHDYLSGGISYLKKQTP